MQTLETLEPALIKLRPTLESRIANNCIQILGRSETLDITVTHRCWPKSD